MISLCSYAFPSYVRKNKSGVILSIIKIKASVQTARQSRDLNI